VQKQDSRSDDSENHQNNCLDNIHKPHKKVTAPAKGCEFFLCFYYSRFRCYCQTLRSVPLKSFYTGYRIKARSFSGKHNLSNVELGVVNPPQNVPFAYGSLTEGQFDAEIDKGMADIRAGRVYSADNVEAEMKRDFGL